jgi:hypothetical protein
MQETIDKWKLNKGLLATKMQMPTGTFCNKLSAKHPTKFSDAELIKLKGILIELRNELDAVTDIEFNSALTALVKG